MYNIFLTITTVGWVDKVTDWKPETLELDCFYQIFRIGGCPDCPSEITPPDQEEINCLLSCGKEGITQCLETYWETGVWTQECNDIGKECGCIRDEEGGEEEEEIRNCVEDCPNPRATECYDYYLENGVWMEGCEEVMTDCGCYDFGTELDCYKQALNYIRKHLTFEPNNACAVLAYVQANFKCYTPEIVTPTTPITFPPLTLPIPIEGGNNTLPGSDDYDEDQRKPIWWYHTDHLGSSTYLTDNFGRPSHYYETLPFGEMMVEHNQSANHPAGVGYDNKFKFNGKELDDATQMYYYGARYYDPRISIFVSVDPLAEDFAGWTPYHYVHNNPINLIDPTGMSAYPPPGGNEGDTWNDQDGSWKFTEGIWKDTTGGGNDMYSDQLAPVEITKDNRNGITKMVDGIMNDFRREALAMVPGNSSGPYGMPMGPDAMSIGGSIGASGGIANFNFTLSLAATGDDVALVYGFDYGIGEFTKPGVGAGVTLNAHNLYGGSTDILNELGGEDLTYSAGYVVKGSYGTSARTIGNNTQAATRGAKTYGVGFGYGVGVSKSSTSVYKLSNLRRDIPNGISRLQNTVLQAITPPKMF